MVLLKNRYIIASISGRTGHVRNLTTKDVAMMLKVRRKWYLEPTPPRYQAARLLFWVVSDQNDALIDQQSIAVCSYFQISYTIVKPVLASFDYALYRTPGPSHSCVTFRFTHETRSSIFVRAVDRVCPHESYSTWKSHDADTI